MRQAVGDEIVDDAAVLVRQERVLRLAVTHAVDVVREHLLEERLRGRAVHVDLAHVRDVEHSRVCAHRAMLLDDALVLDRHLEACERHHACAEGDVTGVQRRALERRFHRPRL